MGAWGDMSRLGDIYPLAPSQETLWEFMRFFAPDDPGAFAVNAAEAVRLRGPLDVERLRAAAATVAARHDALRIVFVDIGEDPSFRVADEVVPEVPLVDLFRLPAPARTQRAAQMIAAAHDWPFDLTRLPLWYVRVIRLGHDDHVVLVNMCHLIGDGWSAHLLLHDLAAAYGTPDGRGREMAPPKTQFRDVMARPVIDGAAAERLTNHWRNALSPLPAGNPFAEAVSPSGIAPGTAIRIWFDFPPGTAQRLGRSAAAMRTTPFVALMGAYRALLAAWTGRDRIVIGTTTSGRDARTRDLIGQFTTNTYLATTVGQEARLSEVVGIVRGEMLAALRHATSFKRIAGAVNRDFAEQRPWPFMNLYDAWFQSDIRRRAPAFPGLAVEPAPYCPPENPDPGQVGVPAGTEWADDPDLRAVTVKRDTPWILINPDCTGAAIEYGPAFFTKALAAEWVRKYQSVVAALLHDPDRRVRDLGLS
jgi:hypothetical protein